MSAQSMPVDKSSRLDDARKIRRALKRFNSSYAGNIIQVDRNLCVEHLKAFRKEIMQKAEDIRKTIKTDDPNCEEAIYIIADYSQDGGGIFWAEKYDNKTIYTQWLYEEFQQNIFCVPENNFFAILDGRISDMHDGKSDQQLQSTIATLLYDRLKDFTETKYSAEYARVLLNEINDSHTRKKIRRHKPSPKHFFIQSSVKTLLGNTGK